MKLQQINFRRPVKILQVFRNVHEYEKTEKSFEDRKQLNEWQPVLSLSGFIKEGQLFLPHTILKRPHFNTCNLIVLLDNNPGDEFDNLHRSFTPDYLRYLKRNGFQKEAETNHCFNLHHPNKLDIFQLHYNEGALELYLQYDHFYVGIPERENFKLSELKSHSPVEVKINGKVDFSMTGRRKRVFREQDYIFDYCGAYDSCYILEEPIDPYIKEVPAERKLVDLWKPLW